MRGIIYLIVSILVVTFIRMVLVMIRSGFRDMMRSEQAAASPPQAPPHSPSGGHLVRDPVCGTYVSEQSPHRKSIGGHQFAYCSATCRDKHQV